MPTFKTRGMIKTLLTIVAASALVLGSSTAATADTGRASVTNSGSATLTVCKSATSATTCAGVVGTLSAGQNSESKYGWTDTDMVRISAGCSLQTWSWSATTGYYWAPFAAAGSSARWLKLPGNPAGTRTYSFRMVC